MNLNGEGSPKIYLKVRGARPKDVESGLTLEHVGSDGVAEASNTAPTRMQPDNPRGHFRVVPAFDVWFAHSQRCFDNAGFSLV